MMIQVRGLTLKARLDFAQARGGERLLQQLRSEPAPVGVIAVAPMIAFHSFPLAADDALCRAIVRHLGAGAALYREMGAFHADTERASQNLLIGARTDPAAIVSAIPRHFQHGVSGMTGRLRREMAAPNRERIIWEEHQTSFESFCECTLGYYQRVLENAGVTGVSGESVQCVARGDKRCAWEFSWEHVSGTRRPTSTFAAVKVSSLFH
jgi:hypothetical protein